ncbi:Phosphatase OS=Streptomyces antimycoticus OX=68175 GN=SANT12839_053730 PE=4 SV=1 [Streptomyces antimycoticus]
MLSTAALRAHLLAARLAGPVATSREESLRRYRLFAARDPRVLLGLEPEYDWSFTELLSLMGAKCGVSVDPANVSGPDVIDPELTIAALHAFADRLRAAAQARLPGAPRHRPPPPSPRFLRRVGVGTLGGGLPCPTPAHGRCIDITTRFGVRTHRLAYVRGIAMVQAPGARPTLSEPGAHSHSPLPVRVALGSAAESGGPLPGLVIGDHGWVCGAGQLRL